MTLQEAKQKIADKYGYDLPEPQNEFDLTHYKMLDEAAELYAKSKWDEACEAQKQIDSNLLNDWEFGGRSQVHHFKDTAKPEFNP